MAKPVVLSINGVEGHRLEECFFEGWDWIGGKKEKKKSKGRDKSLEVCNAVNRAAPNRMELQWTQVTDKA